MSLCLQIWLSKDDVPMVLHGGAQGELSKYGMPDQLVYDWDSKDLASDKIDIGEGCRIPTLESVLTMFKDQNMVLNIELKAPD